jgi:hypothetical protein
MQYGHYAHARLLCRYVQHTIGGGGVESGSGGVTTVGRSILYPIGLGLGFSQSKGRVNQFFSYCCCYLFVVLLFVVDVGGVVVDLLLLLMLLLLLLLLFAVVVVCCC